METNKIKFIEPKSYVTQQSIINLLSDKYYYFERVSPYDADSFFCIIRRACDSKMPQNWIQRNLNKIGIFSEKDEVLRITFGFNVQPIVFNRKDVCALINDLPDNYIGDKMI